MLRIINFKILKIGFALMLIFISFIVYIIFIHAQTSSSDAIAIRVVPNSKHISASDWFRSQGFSGSPQQILVDGFSGVRNGQTAYINAGNAVDSDSDLVYDILYTNIYIISYNQNADSQTADIFGRILNSWKFNSDINSSGFCREDISQACSSDNECGAGDVCDSLHARIVRDVKRASDVAKIKNVLDNNISAGLSLPNFSAGTYIPGRTLSTWPSWKNFASKELKLSLPEDPVNKLGYCDPIIYDEKTCWDERNKRFVTNLPVLPGNSIVYSLHIIDSSNYSVCAVFESGLTILPAVNSGSCPQVCLDFDGDGYGINSAPPPTCAHLGNDCVDSNPLINPGATEICGNAVDENCDTVVEVCPTTCNDIDGDGFDNCPVGFADPSADAFPRDCNLLDPNINPGMPEICDNLDNNCSLGPDEICDVDNDDYCVDTPGLVMLGPPAINTCSSTINTNAALLNATDDCDDADNTVHPSAIELCDGKDNNCNGVVDENCDPDGDGFCSCALSSIIVTGSNLASTCGGTNTTNAGAISNTCDCDEISNSNHPDTFFSAAVEVCDGVDNNCDGSIDENCACSAGSTLVCGIGTGECTTGIQTCDASGNWIEDCSSGPCVIDCVGSVGPQPELCNGLDDNCDSIIDNGIVGAPNVDDNTGVCSGRLKQCLSGAWDNAYSTIAGYESTETSCDGFDNNCNGSVDEGLLNACGTCGLAPAEICNGLDDDCDGAIDNGVTNACGGCGPVPIEVCDGVDNNCDGNVDEGVANACGGCGPVPAEVCDGVDNNCDGSIDEGCPCIEGSTQSCALSHIGACAVGNETCTSGVWVGCPAPGTEDCNNLDDDCDGTADNNLPNLLTANQFGVCLGHLQTCIAGVWNTDYSTIPTNEWPTELTCDSLDNNCNGSVDEEWTEETCEAVCEATVPQLWCSADTYCCGNDAGEGALAQEIDPLNPATFSNCSDGVDNDCDCLVDIDPECTGISTCIFPISFPCDL